MSAALPPYDNGYTTNNKVRLVRGGREYFDLLLTMIARAKDTIHLQTYIFDDDETGILVAEALKQAVQRKVQVYLLADGYASQVMSQVFIDDLRRAGVHFRFFEPLFKNKYYYFGRRLHHKVVVVDTLYAMVGGMNITNRYNDMAGEPAWLDFALYAEGEIAKQLCVLCWKSWKGFPLHLEQTSCEQTPSAMKTAEGESVLVRMRRNDWVRRKNQVSRTYIEMFRNARSHVTILGSYFLPGTVIRRNLIHAAKRGIKIRLIMAGSSDVPLSKFAERYIYKHLLENNVEIFEYKDSILHGKLAVCDGEWLTVGSYNVNNISAYASIELNLDVKNASVAAEAGGILDEIIARCTRITPQWIRQENIFRRFVNWLSYGIIKAGLYIFTFYFRQKLN
jgi:cardiolipin synthase A/B